MEYIFHYMDQKNEVLLRELRKNSKLSIQKLSKATKLPTTTVFNRIKRLEKQGVIKQYTIKLDNKQLGFVQAFIEVSLNPSVNVNEFIKKIKSKVDDIYMIAGEYQILIKATFPDLGGVYNFTALLQQTKADKIKTTLVLDEL